MSEQKQGHLVDELRKIFQAWRNHWFLKVLQYQALRALGRQPDCRFERALVNYESFFDFLLHLRPDLPRPISIGQFQPPLIMPQLVFQQTIVIGQGQPQLPSVDPDTGLKTLPVQLAGFTLERLVYELDADATARLMSSSLPEDLTLADIRFPAEAFAFRLSSPLLKFGQPGPSFHESRFVLVGIDRPFVQEGQNPALTVRTISTTYLDYRPLGPEECMRLQGMADRHEWVQLEQEVEVLIKCTYLALSGAIAQLDSGEGGAWNIPLVQHSKGPISDLFCLVAKFIRLVDSLPTSGGSGGGGSIGGGADEELEEDVDGQGEEDPFRIKTVAYVTLEGVVRRLLGTEEGEGTRGPSGPREEHTVHTFKRKPRGSPPGTPKTEVVREHKRGRKPEGLPGGQIKKIRRRREGDQGTAGGAGPPPGS